MSGRRRTAPAALAALALAAALPAPAAAQAPAKAIFGAIAAPSPGPPAAIGSYARGCLAGAVELPETGPAWQAMRLSRNRNWGHPAAIAFIARLGLAAQAAGWQGLYIGDISQPRGGPMRSGHASHQLGLDIDIWMRQAKRLNLSRQDRETLGSVSVLAADRRSVTRDWTPAHAAILRAAAEDPAVARIFVTAPVKIALCEGTAPGDRAWLRKVRPWWGHHEHFHVRLECPADSPLCTAQDPIPPGEGCDETLYWWISEEALNPPPAPPAPPKPDLTLDDLPPECRAIAEAG
jgi:penicillin-insensitive murein endopeptidase